MAEKGRGVRVTPEVSTGSQSDLYYSSLVGKARIGIQTPYFPSKDMAIEWVQRNIPTAQNVRGNIFELADGVRIVIQVAKVAVKWE